MNIGINKILMNDSEELDFSKCQPISDEEIQALAKKNKNTSMYTLEVTIKLLDSEQKVQKEVDHSIGHYEREQLDEIAKKLEILFFESAIKL